MKYFKYIYFILIALIITDSFRYLSWTGNLDIGFGTYLSVLLNYTSLAIMIFMASKIDWEFEIPGSIKFMFKLWMLNNIIGLIRATFLASDYWEWKMLALASESFSLIPLAFFLGMNLELLKYMVTFIFKYLFPLGFIFIPLALVTNPELYSRLMIPVCLFILFIPYVKLKWKVLIIVVAITSFFMDLTFRSNVIKITFSFLLLPIFYFKNYIKLFWIRIARWGLFIIPVILLSLAVLDIFNIFTDLSNDDSGYSVVNNNGDEVNLTDDTRTFLYQEVIGSLIQSESLWYGESAIASYHSEVFTELTGTSESNKRYGCEVGFLNFLLRYGIIGITVYFLVIFTISFYAINKSNNTLAKMLGLWLAFRWTYSFVEEFTQYDLNFLFFWIAMGLVSSSTFRRMDDSDIKKYLEFI